MATIELKNSSGANAGQVELADGVFAQQPNVPLMHQVVTAQLAARRAGTQSTKTRAEVSGGGRKPFKQKGTGNARQGSTRAPHWSGGGVALGPKPRKYTQRTPKKMIKAALRSALSDRAAEGKVIVVNEWTFDRPSTKAGVAALKAFGLENSKVLVVLRRDDENAALSFRNLQNVQLIDVAELNAYDVLINEYVVFTQATLPTDAGGAGDVVEGKYGAGSAAALASGAAPKGYDIKGNEDSMLYHVPGSRFYKATVAEVWFATEADAERAGFSKPGSQKSQES
ncbi:MAG: 50S ribosomal protein L4 [Acidimicrobiia bacterium]